MNVIIVQHLITQFALEVFKASKQCSRQADQPINQLSKSVVSYHFSFISGMSKRTCDLSLYFAAIAYFFKKPLQLVSGGKNVRDYLCYIRTFAPIRSFVHSTVQLDQKGAWLIRL